MSSALEAEIESGGHGTTVIATGAGFEAIGVEPAPTRADAQTVKTGTPRAGSKQSVLVDMLRAEGGASIEELVAATGWQAHYADARIMPM
jgi:hypothetical protein